MVRGCSPTGWSGVGSGCGIRWSADRPTTNRLLDASRQPAARHTVPLYRPPATLASRKPWYTRQEMDTLPEARAALRAARSSGSPTRWMHWCCRSRAPAGCASPSLTARRPGALAFAGTNDQPYRSVGGWLLQQGALRDASWPGIKAWVAQNPQRLNEMLWSNPRMVFFREEPLSTMDAGFGPRGAQGVALTPGRSIAVDRESIPYGTPVWLASPGPCHRSSCSAWCWPRTPAPPSWERCAPTILPAGAREAGELAGRLKQPLQMWVLWPK
jgi:membrane-bound lytic murein transglycosylase A